VFQTSQKIFRPAKHYIDRNEISADYKFEKSQRDDDQEMLMRIYIQKSRESWDPCLSEGVYGVEEAGRMFSDALNGFQYQHGSVFDFIFQ
jgi:hypothetical protein